MTFAMSMDAVHRKTTVLVCTLLPLVTVAVCITMFSAPLPGRLGPYVGYLVLGSVIVPGLVAAAWAPRAVEVTGSVVRVQRRAWSPLEIPISEITSLENGPVIGQGRSLRLGGVGGFFASYGLFWTQGLGKYRLYTTRLGPSVLLQRKTGIPVVIAVDDLDGLRAALQERLPFSR